MWAGHAVTGSPWIAAGDGALVSGTGCRELKCSHQYHHHHHRHHLRELFYDRNPGDSCVKVGSERKVATPPGLSVATKGC